MFITLVDLDVNVLRTCTTVMLSMWKSMRLLITMGVTTGVKHTGNNSKNVMSQITSENIQWVGHFE